MTQEEQEEVKLLKELIADKSISADEREIYEDALNELMKSEKPKAMTSPSKPKTTQRKTRTAPTKKVAPAKTKQTPTDVEKAKAEIKAKTGKTEAECESIIEQYRSLRTKAQEGKRKAEQASADNKERVGKLERKGDIIDGTNEKTADAVIESTAKDVAQKIEKEVEAIEKKATTEAKAEVAKDKSITSAKDKKEAVEAIVDDKVKAKTKTIVKRVVIDTSALLTSIATSLGKFDKDSQKEFLIKLRSDIDKLISKYAFGGMTDGATQVMNVQQSNMSSSSVNPSHFGEGGNVGGLQTEIHQLKRKLVAQAKSKGISENFGQKEVRMLKDKYPMNYSVGQFDEWVQNFDLYSLDSYAKGGGVRIGYAIMQGDNLRTDAFGIVEFFDTIEKALFKMSHVPRFKALTKEEKIKLIIPYTHYPNRYTMANGGGVGKPMIRKISEGYYEDENGDAIALNEEEDGSGYYFLDTTNGFSGGVSKSKATTKDALMRYIAKNYKVVRTFEGGGGVGKEKVFEAQEDGIIGISSGSDAYTMEISKGDKFVTHGSQDNEYWWFVKMVDKRPRTMRQVNSFDYDENESRINVNTSDLLLTFPRGDKSIYAEMKEVYAGGGGVRIGSDGREYPYGSAWKLEHNKNNKNEDYEVPTSKRKYSVGGTLLSGMVGAYVGYQYGKKGKKAFKFEDGGVIGQEIVFDDRGEENTGVIKDITNAGDYIVLTDNGRSVLAKRDMDVISLGAMAKAPMMEAPRKRFGFFAGGGGVDNPSRQQMLDYLNMYFDYYSELRTIAVEEDNILTRRMLKSLDDEELEIAYDDAQYEIKADTQFEHGGGVDNVRVIDLGKVTKVVGDYNFAKIIHYTDAENLRAIYPRGYVVYFYKADGTYIKSGLDKYFQHEYEFKDAIQYAKENVNKIDNEKFAQGGMTEHGLMEGDKIVFDHLDDDKIDIIDRNGKKHVVDLDKGKRYN